MIKYEIKATQGKHPVPTVIFENEKYSLLNEFLLAERSFRRELLSLVNEVDLNMSDSESFTGNAAFMMKLQAIIEKYNLAQFNGRDVVTHGLPDDFGATLSVTYASGEKIYAADNQNMYLPVEAVRELAQLFYSAS